MQRFWPGWSHLRPLIQGKGAGRKTRCASAIGAAAPSARRPGCSRRARSSGAGRRSARRSMPSRPGRDGPSSQVGRAERRQHIGGQCRASAAARQIGLERQFVFAGGHQAMAHEQAVDDRPRPSARPAGAIDRVAPNGAVKAQPVVCTGGQNRDKGQGSGADVARMGASLSSRPCCRGFRRCCRPTAPAG